MAVLLLQSIKQLQQSRKEAEHLYLAEKTVVKELRRELLYYKNQMEEAQRAKLEAKRCVDKLKILQNMQTLITGELKSCRQVS